MATMAVSPIELCPIHFGDLALFNRKIGNLDEVLLYSKICFHQQHSKINHTGKQCIARTRQAMANWFGWSLRKVDGLLASLEKKGFISKAVGLWKGIKAFFVSAVKHISYLPINITKLNTLIGHTGSVLSAVIFSRIAFGMNNTKIEHEGIKWCAIKKEVFADLVGISIRTLDKILNSLQEKGLILKKNFIHRGKRQMHYHIPECVIGAIVGSMKKAGCQASKKEQIKNDFRDQNGKKLADIGDNKATGYPHQNCRVEPAKSSSSIKEDQILQKTKNITKHDNQSGVNEKPKLEKLAISDIQFLQNQFKSDVGVHSPKEGRADQVEKCFFQLSKRQQDYIRGVISRLIRRDNVISSNPKELKEQLCYAVANDMQYKHLSFKHAVNRHAKVILSGNWTTPYGFYKHSVYGRKALQKRVDAEKRVEANKRNPSMPMLPGSFEDLLKLNLSGVGRGSEVASVNDQCDGTTVHADTPSVSGNVMAVKDQPATESIKTGTTKMSRGGTVLMLQGGSVGLSQATVLSGEEAVSVTATRPQSRVDALNASIARCQDRLSTVTGEARDAADFVLQLSYTCSVLSS